MKSNENTLLNSHPEFAISPELNGRFELYPENRRRPVNKVVYRNVYFQLTYNMKNNAMSITSRGDIVYSAIPYDTARNYIQRAAIQYLIHPIEVHQYIEFHKSVLEKYLIASIYQINKRRVDEKSPEIIRAYEDIFKNPLFEIQILGRLLQHNETGPLSANLAGKFLLSENVKTGISEYISEYLKFVVQLTNVLPIMTDGKNIYLLGDNLQEGYIAAKQMYQCLNFESDINLGLNLFPQEVKHDIENSFIVGNKSIAVNNKPLLRSEFGKELSEVRKNYIAHSVPPEELEQYFENVLPIENRNIVNVISDIHRSNGSLPFKNENFNILAGDIANPQVIDENIRGIYVIGNHELLDVLPDTNNMEDIQWDKWNSYLKYEWFKDLLQKPDKEWFKLPVGDHRYYKTVKSELEKRFPNIHLLNNSSYTHNGIRYIGLTIPVVLVKRRTEQQKFILKALTKLLSKDYTTPTVIVSHAPLFNELSMLSSKSQSYNNDYICSEPKIEKLFKDFNIIGAIHGHHHIPASKGRYKTVNFAEKEVFVVCSIYSKMNTGFELLHLLKLYTN